MTFAPARPPAECGYEIKGIEINFQGGTRYDVVATLDVDDSTEFLREAVRSYEEGWPGHWRPETFGAAANQVLLGHHDGLVTEELGLEIESKQIVHDYRFLPEHYEALSPAEAPGI
jgi:hypothetical protein